MLEFRVKKRRRRLVKMRRSCEFLSVLCPYSEFVSECSSLRNATLYEEEDKESVLSQKVRFKL